jgi:hypothetical protein
VLGSYVRLACFQSFIGYPVAATMCPSQPHVLDVSATPGDLCQPRQPKWSRTYDYEYIILIRQKETDSAVYTAMELRTAPPAFQKTSQDFDSRHRNRSASLALLAVCKCKLIFCNISHRAECYLPIDVREPHIFTGNRHDSQPRDTPLLSLLPPKHALPHPTHRKMRSPGRQRG